MLCQEQAMNKEQRLQTIQTTEKALELLQIVASGEENLNIPRLSQRMNISREEVVLLLVAMENKGLVSWDSYRKIYSPGGTTLEIARNLTRDFSRPTPLRTVAAMH
jgi:DNA-binding IclR family transcriptional regulator